ncbi:MAG: anthranilate phosphoribosyltransferase [Deltaproteobacteria bacterium RIFCSPLOWO2_02_FULL_57_26]|nr:MAG: anthranilate phosphoribosyltransferase [Deltaproteobacteria bacterium RIFCSPLOWO2_02_FULL_57_26]
MDIKEAIGKLVNRTDLTEGETEDVMNQIMSGDATVSQVAAFLTALRMKGETVQEITGAARVMREKVHRVRTKADLVLDIVGTGGDQKGTINISTASAFVVAGAGITVAKHGNRSVSSQSGSADVLAALGVKIDASKERVEECLEKIGIGFLFAPLLHEAMKYAVQPRREIGIRTIFNLLGPLTNPAGATHQLTGLYDGGLTEPIAHVLKNLGTARAMIVHGLEGMDEVSLCGPTRVSELRDGKIKTYTVSPEEFGLKPCRLEDLHGGTPEQCAALLRGVLGGEKGPKRDVVLLNSGAALYVSGKAQSIEAGMRLAGESIDSGKAQGKLDQLVRMTNAS